jgi:hypothetical protein
VAHIDPESVLGAPSWRTEPRHRQDATHGPENERPFEHMTADDAEDNRDRHDRGPGARTAEGASAATSDRTGDRNSDASSDRNPDGGGVP